MTLLDSLKEAVNGVPTLKGPVFLKETNDADRQLKELEKLLAMASGEVKKQMEQDMKMLTYGIIGENNVAFELKNSFIPMLVLHDLYLTYGDLTTQIDYLIITKKVKIVIECKNLMGNMEVNSNGDFIRWMEFGKIRKKEGIYSPITQNQRHLEMIKKLRLESKNVLSRTLLLNNFENNYKSVIVLANPKTVLNMKYAKKEVKEKIIRADQLIEYIKKENKKSDNPNYSDREMYEIANFFLKAHQKNEVDYTKRYQEMMSVNVGETHEDETIPKSEEKTTPNVEGGIQNVREKNSESMSIQLTDMKIENTEIYNALKEYRLAQSRAEKVKAYFIFNNNQLEDIISKKPTTIEELKQISGFAEVKCQKYGEKIINICRQYD